MSKRGEENGVKGSTVNSFSIAKISEIGMRSKKFHSNIFGDKTIFS